MTRLTKQLLYGGFYLAIVLAIVWGLYRAAVPAPTCTDGIRNQGEEGVDCGAVCGKSCPVALIPLPAPEVRIIKYGPLQADTLIKLDNPNATYGTPAVPYTLTVSDDSGKVLLTRSGSTFANPLETHYIVIPLIGLTAEPAKADLQMDSSKVQWATLDTQTMSDIEFSVRQDQLVRTDGKLRFQADVINGSQFDFDQVQVSVLLYDGQGQIVGSGSTVISTISSGQLRGIVVDWPFDVPTAMRARAFVTTNIFDNANYLRAHGSQEQFQSF